MKKLSNLNDVEKLEQLSAAIAARKAAERLEKELKGYFLALMDKETSLTAGGYLLLRDERTLVSLDKKALEARLGAELHDFEKETHYSVVTVRKA